MMWRERFSVGLADYEIRRPTDPDWDDTIPCYSDHPWARATLAGLACDAFALRALRRFFYNELERGAPPLDDHALLDRLAGHLVSRHFQLVRHDRSLPPRSYDFVLPTPPRERRPAAEVRTWVEIVLLDQADRPVPGARYRLFRKALPVTSGTLDLAGFARIDGLKPDSYEVSLPELDADAWEPRAGALTPSGGAGTHVVEPGECMASIADQRGFFWQKLWEHPKNAGLRQQRENPNVLLAGDEVFVPDRMEKRVPVSTEHRHVFRRKGVPSCVRFRVMEHGRPLADVPYVLELEGGVHRDTADGDGYISLPVAPGARSGVLTVETDLGPVTYEVGLGRLDPVTEVAGVQQRLRNLGLDCEASGELDEPTREALAAFQSENDLTASGKIDQATRDRLVAMHGA